ncbi:murein biosynthesis integral membrane protein MurJ [Clostridium sp.]|jgi:putative peptidoglycan lipid II flippase|uniref:murein biosynthesis integral membrane protein MurJ n=1 Tax=Clostridium sp. TaxID=1506 RepID=UPI0025BEC4A1|nr:murein biosynthesis integral membrane protein MurJ [Clostridium sp.]
MRGNKIFKAAFLVMIIGILSRFLGLFRDILVGYQFGVSIYTDAYKAAVSVPETIFTIVGLAISTVFIPMLSKVKYEKSKDEMFKFSNNIISILLVISIIVFSLGFLFTDKIVGFMFDGFTKDKFILTVFLTRITLFNLLFLSINACYTAMLQVCEDFVIPSILGMFFNAPMIIYLLFFNDINIIGLTIANVIGNFLRVVVQVPVLYKHGYKFKLFINIKDERIKKILMLIIPVIIGSGANSLNMIVDMKVASSLGDGAVSALDFAQKIIVFANTAITTSIVSVMYPLMANKLNEGDNEGFSIYLTKSISIIALLLVPISIGFILLNKELISAFYERGKFNDIAVGITASAFLGYSLVLPFTGIRDILNSSLFSMQKTKVTTINGVIGVVVNIILSISLSKIFGIFGVALASTIASIITAILLFISTRKFVGNFNVIPMIIKLLKILLSAIIMFFVLVMLNNILVLNNSILTILFNFIIGVIVYFIVCKILKIEELNEAIYMIRNKVSKKGN